MIAHVALAAMSPLLHAHSAEPFAHHAGFHLFVAAVESELGICPLSGDTEHVLTAEVSDKRIPDEPIETISPSPIANSMVARHLRHATMTNRWPDLGRPSFNDAPRTLVGYPQAP